MLKKHFLATRVNAYVYKSVRMLAKGLGISISEYLRNLILQDLNSKKMLDDNLKKTVDQFDRRKDVRKKPVNISRKFFLDLWDEE